MSGLDGTKLLSLVHWLMHNTDLLYFLTILLARSQYMTLELTVQLCCNARSLTFRSCLLACNQ